MAVQVDVRREVAQLLLAIGSVSVETNVARYFKYASGKSGPIYCDNRLIISYPDKRRLVVNRLVEKLEAELGDQAFDVIAGTATAGIPWAAWVADRLDKPMVYVRSAAKDHGKGQQIEGRLRPGQRAVVVEDHVSTGGSALSAVQALREVGCAVDACLAIFTYELPSTQRSFADQGVRLLALTGLDALLTTVVEQGYIAPEQRATVEEAIARAFAKQT